jgi:hypothetical protein
MNIFVQALMAMGVAALVIGYFQFRRTGDILDVFQEVFRAQYLLPLIGVGIAYIIIKGLFSLLGVIF